MLGRKPAVRLAHVTSGDGGNILLGISLSPLIPDPKDSVKIARQMFPFVAALTLNNDCTHFISLGAAH